MAISDATVGADARADALPFDPARLTCARDPYPVYAAFRRTRPAYWHPSGGAGGQGAWFFFRHADVSAVLRDARFGRDRACPRHRQPSAPREDDPLFPLVAMKRRWLLFRDAPSHTPLRLAFGRGFGSGTMERLRTTIEGTVEALLDRAEGSLALDVIGDLAAPLAAQVISTLLGLEDEDRDDILQHAAAVTRAVLVSRDADDLARAASACEWLRARFMAIIRARRLSPGDDLISAMAAPSGAAAIDDEDLVANYVLLMLAGQETTTSIIGNAVWALLCHPAELRGLRDDPGLLPSAVEELLRYDAPAQMSDRFAHADVEIGGQAIRAGAQVWAVFGSANRDEAVFADPDRLDLGRSGVAHRSFGLGAHYCLGAALGRLELQSAIAGLLRRFPRLRHEGAEPERCDSLFVRAFKALPLRL